MVAFMIRFYLNGTGLSVQRMGTWAVTNEGGVELLSFGIHIGGTLIKWCILVGNGQLKENENA